MNTLLTTQDYPATNTNWLLYPQQNVAGLVFCLPEKAEQDADGEKEATAEAAQQTNPCALRMTLDMLWLLKHKPADGLTWQGKMIDLFSFIHTVQLAGHVYTPDGLPVTFRKLMNQVCQVLHVRAPRNPYAYFPHDARRKGLKALPLLMRYHGLKALGLEL